MSNKTEVSLEIDVALLQLSGDPIGMIASQIDSLLRSIPDDQKASLLSMEIVRVQLVPADFNDSPER